MKLLKPFSLLRSQKDPEATYAKHRFWIRFLHVAGAGVQRVADEHARRIIAANQAIGEKLDLRLKDGFEEVNEYQREIHHALIDQTQVVKRGFDAVEFRLEEGFEQTASALSEVADRVDNVGSALLATGDKLSQGIRGLNASLDMGMMNILSQFELQRGEIQEGFDKLTGLLENSRKTEAEERYRDGKQDYERYLQLPDEPQFLTDAYDYLQESVRIYRGNPFCHLYLGHIYQEPAQYFDLDKSLEHYQLCATYAKGIPNKSLAALGYFMAAWIAFAKGELETAIQHGEAAKEYDPDGIPENYYNLAKFYAVRANPTSALYHLETVIRQYDPRYSLKADSDEDFTPIRPELDAFFERLREEAANDWEQKMKPYQST
ncbi:MAG: hypothetical protein AAF399_12230 [Bacteroidota bacterium]